MRRARPVAAICSGTSARHGKPATRISIASEANWVSSDSVYGARPILDLGCNPAKGLRRKTP